MPGIKIFALGVRRKDMTAERFHDHWRHPHGTWGRTMPILRGYVQSHQIHSEFLGPEQSRRECVAEMWLDNERDMLGFQQDPVYEKYLHDDADNFVDYSQAIYFPVSEEVLVSGSSTERSFNPGDDMWSVATRPFSIKLLHFVGQDGNQDWASEEDEQLSRDLQALRHVRCRPYARTTDPAPRFRGVQELWWPTQSAFRAGVTAAPQALKKLLANGGDCVTLVAQAERFL
jgi:hypothetical protein